MLKIDFWVCEDVIAREMISKSRMPVEFANYLWDKYKKSYMELQHNPMCDKNLIDYGIISELKEQEFFKKFLIEAKENKDTIEKLWAENCDIINEFLKKILRTDYSLAMTAYIVSPRLKLGHNLGNNCLVWGHSNGNSDKNYNLVYLVHEALHSYFPSDNFCHAIIENIADIELARFLNHSDTSYTCHDFTLNEHLKIYPFWNLYLKRSEVEIERLQKIDKIQYDIKAFEKYRESLAGMNIDEFINFAKKIKDNIAFDTYYTLYDCEQAE